LVLKAVRFWKNRRNRMKKKKSSPTGNGSRYEPLLTYAELAPRLNVTERNLRSMVQRRVVPAILIGHRTIRFLESRVREALAKREVREVA
jgi:excisionase family DNA binding protein